MDSRRWMAIDDSWMYSKHSRRQPDRQQMYRTLPRRSQDAYRPDIPRRPCDGRGKYGTIPGRYADNGPGRDPFLYRQQLTSRPQSVVLQDSTNWEPFLPLGTRGVSMDRLEHKSDSRRRGRYHHDRDRNTKNILENERRRHKSSGDVESGNHIQSKHRQKRNLGSRDSIYGEWQFESSLENMMKASKQDEWEPFLFPPKAFKNQTLSQINTSDFPAPQKTESTEISTESTTQEKRNKLDFSVLEKNKSLETTTSAATHEKGGWWSKLLKHSIFAASEAFSSEAPQDKSIRTNNELSFLVNNGVHKQEGLKENQVPQIRKRKGPPPYVPPPSYDYPHRTFSFINNTFMHSQGLKISCDPVLPNERELFQESREKLPRCKVYNQNTPKIDLPDIDIRESRVKTKTKHNPNPKYHSINLQQQFSHAYSTREGSKSDDPDHIYEVVEGGDYPMSSDVPIVQKGNYIAGLPPDKIYQSLPITHQKDFQIQHTIPRVSGNRIYEGIDQYKSRNTRKKHQCQISSLDERPPVPLHGVKLPRELGFSYTSGKPTEMGQRYTKIKETYSNEPGNDRQRALRVIASKDSKMKVHSKFAPYKYEHGWYSHTLPIKKDYMRDDLTYQYPRKQSKSKHDTELAKWEEPRKVGTLPCRGHDQYHWRGEENLKLEMKYNLSEPYIRHDTGRKRQSKRESPEKMQVLDSKESDGLFVIDATCVMVRAEYIFPPVMEQVTFLNKRSSKENGLFSNEHSLSSHKNETDSNQLVCSNTALSSTTRPGSKSNLPDADKFRELSPERVAPNLKERAIRILGISVGDLEYSDETLGKENDPKANKNIMDIRCHEKADQLVQEKTYSNNRSDYKLRNCTGLPCIQEVSEIAGDCEDNIKMLLSDIQIAESNKQISGLLSTMTSSSEIQTKNLKADCSSKEEPQISNHISSLPDVDSHLPKAAIWDMSPGIVSSHEPLEIARTQEYQKDLEPKISEKLRHSSMEAETSRVHERSEMQELENKESSTKEDLKPETENNTQAKLEPSLRPKAWYIPKNQQQNTSKYPREGPNLHCSGELEESDYASKCKESCQNVAKQPVKVYVRRPNYFAKDLMEAVSRIRRHTAPDSDTDDDVDQSVLDSNNNEDQGLDESLSAGSSDTSDSEVTVIMCDSERENSDTLLSHDASGTDNNTIIKDDVNMKDLTDAPSPPVSHAGDAVQSEGFLGPALDLNSCIQEILQDLTRTEQEYFSSNED
ncbi:dendrin [Gastrophryne carolinensis]